MGTGQRSKSKSTTKKPITYKYKGKTYADEAGVKAAIRSNIVTNLPESKKADVGGGPTQRKGPTPTATDTGAGLSRNADGKFLYQGQEIPSFEWNKLAGMAARGEQLTPVWELTGIGAPPPVPVPAPAPAPAPGLDEVNVSGTADPTIPTMPETEALPKPQQSGAAAPITADDLMTILSGFGGFTKSFFTSVVGKKATKEVTEAAAGKLIKPAAFTIAEKTRILANTVTDKLTTSLLIKLGIAAGTVILVKDMIGTYPFAGFIKEEALQQGGFAVEQAIRNDDLGGAEAALKIQEETLDPSGWDKILAMIPYANILTELKDFYKSARAKLDVDKERVEKLKKEVEGQQGELEAKKINQEVETAKWEQIEADRQAQREQERAADETYFRQLEENRTLAQAQGRAEDEAYYQKIIEDRDAAEAAKRKEDSVYWEGVRKVQEENAKRLEQEKREADMKYWEGVMDREAEIREERREKERKEDEAYYKKIAANKKKADNEKREADAKYWESILAQQEARDEEKRKGDEAYWANITKAREDLKKSQLLFGLL